MGLAASSGSKAEPADRRRLLVAVNPKKRRAPELATALARFAAAEIDVDVVDLSLLTDDRRRALAAARACSGVVVAGGDGTLCLAASFLREAGRPVGILPMGTANDFARTMAIPVDLVSAAETILAGHTRLVDLGEVNGHLYFNVASIGISTTLTTSLTKEVKRRWGRAAYAVTALNVAATSEPFSAHIVSPRASARVRTLQIAVGNGRYYGGGTAIDANATIDDSLLHLYSLEMTRPSSLIPMLWSFRQGTHGRWASVRTLVDTEFEITTFRPRPVNADGEIVTTTPSLFRVIPKSLTVLAPAST